MIPPVLFKVATALALTAVARFAATDLSDPVIRVLAMFLLGAAAGIIVPFLVELAKNPRTKFGWDYVVPKLASAALALIFFAATGDLPALLNQPLQVVFAAGLGVVFPGEFIRKALTPSISKPPVISPAPPSPPPTD